MIIEDQSKEFFLNSPNNIHLAPVQIDGSHEWTILADAYAYTLLLGKYRDRSRATEVYEEIKKLMLKRKKYYCMPRE